jgi:enoyl-CoA hydratase/carnithine racemase
MGDPMKILRGAEVEGLVRGEALHQWVDGRAGLIADRVNFGGKQGVHLAYSNPPVHQVGNPGLDATLFALELIEANADPFDFLLLGGPCDPAHAGGDIRESLTRLDATIAKRDEIAAAGASDAEQWALYDWGDARLDKGFTLYQSIRRLSETMVTVSICGGGIRFGGSAEAALMADYLVGDSRSGMCFSEVQIGLIPGWGGVGRAITKAGFDDARQMAYTADVARAVRLVETGIYDRVVEIDQPLPRMQRTGDKEADKAAYLGALTANELAAGSKMLEAALQLAVDPPQKRDLRADAPDLDMDDIRRRATPATFDGLHGTRIREVKDRIAELGRPLAPQSIEALDALFQRFEGQEWDEEAFIRAEQDADAALYRDPRFRAGIVATLEQRVADFRRP